MPIASACSWLMVPQALNESVADGVVVALLLVVTGLAWVGDERGDRRFVVLMVVVVLIPLWIDGYAAAVPLLVLTVMQAGYVYGLRAVAAAAVTLTAVDIFSYVYGTGDLLRGGPTPLNIVLHLALNSLLPLMGALVRRAEQIALVDDGPGARPGSGPGAGGFGLRSLRERATALGGTLVSGPAPGGGWRVESILPLVPDAVRR